MNAPTKRIENLLVEEGMEVEMRNSSVTCYVHQRIDTYSVREEWNPETQEWENKTVELAPYQITYHQGMMPAHHAEDFETLQELANAMREIADLRKWRVCDVDY